MEMFILFFIFPCNIGSIEFIEADLSSLPSSTSLTDMDKKEAAPTERPRKEIAGQNQLKSIPTIRNKYCLSFVLIVHLAIDITFCMHFFTTQYILIFVQIFVYNNFCKFLALKF